MKILVDGIEVRIVENMLAQTINNKLREYVQEVLRMNYSSYLSDRSEQNFADLDMHCGDLVSQIGDIRAISFEVKLKDGNQLPAFEDDQHVGLVALANVGVPVHYAYNNFSFRNRSRPADVSLDSFATSIPVKLPGKIPDTKTHGNLRVLVDSLIAGATTFDSAIYSMAVKNIASLDEAAASQLNTKSLLLLYNKSLKSLAVLDDKAAKHLVEELKNKALISSSKASAEFTQKLSDFNDEIVQALKNNSSAHPPPQPPLIQKAKRPGKKI